MLHGNPEASAKALAKAGLTWDEIDVIEVNEAFASVVAQFLADTGLQERYEAGDVNPNGGGISLGHPLGATGARITATLVSELERRNARYGLATMCIGFGQAIAAVIERVASSSRKLDAYVRWKTELRARSATCGIVGTRPRSCPSFLRSRAGFRRAIASRLQRRRERGPAWRLEIDQRRCSLSSPSRGAFVSPAARVVREPARAAST